MSKLPCITTHPIEKVKLGLGKVLAKEATVAVLAVAAMGNRKKAAQHTLPIPP